MDVAAKLEAKKQIWNLINVWTDNDDNGENDALAFHKLIGFFVRQQSNQKWIPVRYRSAHNCYTDCITQFRVFESQINYFSDQNERKYKWGLVWELALQLPNVRHCLKPNHIFLLEHRFEYSRLVICWLTLNDVQIML